MKPLFLACLLLVAGPVGASQHEPTYTKEEIMRELRVALAEYGPQLKHDRDCLARMEEAMKAMNDFIVLSNNETRGEVLFYVDPTVFKDKLALWEAVKNECWSKP